MHRWSDDDPRARQDPRLRIGDADRDEALARLGEHFAAGRLDKDEFDERSDAVWSAKTGADLAPVFADLEPPPELRSARGAPHRGWPRRGWPVPFLPVLLVLIGLTALTHLPFVLLAFVGWLVFARRWTGRWTGRWAGR